MGRPVEYTLEPTQVRKSEGHLPQTPSGGIEETDKRLIKLNQEAADLALGVRRSGEQWASKAFEFGLWLTYAKQQSGHGNWLSRLQRLGISQQAANNYMRLSNHHARGDLLTASNVTKAMELAGVRKPETTKADAGDQSTKARLPESLDAIAISFKRWQQTQLNPNIGNATDAMLLTWEAALRPMHLAYEAVSERLRK